MTAKATRRTIFFTLMSGTFMASLDSSIVNVSIPTMMAELHCGVSDIEWIVTAYILAFAVVIPLVNWMRERFGFASLYLTALILFVVGSTLCAVVHDLNSLIFARVLQGLGGGALAPTALAILSTIYPSEERGRAIGIWGLGVVIGPAIGPTLGGFLTQQFGWPSIFLINLPVGIAAIITAVLTLKKITAPRKRNTPFDVWGCTTFTVFLITGLLSVTRIELLGFQTEAFVLAAVSVASLALFLKIENTMIEQARGMPLVNLRLFQNIEFRSCILITFARSAALMGGVFLLPFLLQESLRYSETQSGMIMFPGSALVACMMPFAGRWSDVHGPRGITSLGLLLVIFSMMIFAYFSASATLAVLLSAMIFRGIGLGLLVTPISTATINSVLPDEITEASSLSSLAQQIGGAIGVCILALIHEVYRKSWINHNYSAAIADSRALSLCFWVASGFIVFTLWPARNLTARGARVLPSAPTG